MILSPLKSIECEVGFGPGFGGEINANVGSINLGVQAEYKAIDKISINKFKFDVGTESFKGINIGLKGTSISCDIGEKYYHSFFNAQCACDILKEPIFQRADFCPAAKIQPYISDPTIGLGFGAFLGIGAEFNLNINLKTLEAEYDRIFNASLSK